MSSFEKLKDPKEFSDSSKWLCAELHLTYLKQINIMAEDKKLEDVYGEEYKNIVCPYTSVKETNEVLNYWRQEIIYDYLTGDFSLETALLWGLPVAIGFADWLETYNFKEENET